MELAKQAALEADFWGPPDDMLDAAVDMRTAVTALKAALDRPPVRPTNANAPHLKLTASLQLRKREKFAPPEHAASRGKLANGMAGPQRAGGAAEDMQAGVATLQQQMGASLARGGAVGGATSGDPEGDACVASLQSMLNAMSEMQVGAGGGAPPAQPAHA